jgi:acyl-CoA synthetase (AMP-forming)/AMP-acid ligase II
VEEAVVFTVPDGEGSSALRAAVVVGAGTPPTEREILGDLRRTLPAYALPSAISFVASMPRTPTGKVDVKVLAGQAAERVAHDGE